MPAVRKSWRLMVVGMLLGVGAAVAALWSKDADLDVYTSPSFTFRGEQVRVRTLCPRGWVAAEPKVLSIGNVGPDKPDRPCVVIVIVPPKSIGWMRSFSSWLRGREFTRAEREAELRVYVDEAAEGDAGDRAHLLAWPADFSLVKCASLTFTGLGAVSYCRSNNAEFEATYRPICESFRVVR